MFTRTNEKWKLSRMKTEIKIFFLLCLTILVHVLLLRRNKDTDRGKKLLEYDHEIPLIWIGGVPRSGTTLSRAMLDAHPDVRCGQETRILPRVLNQHAKVYNKTVNERKRLDAAGVTVSVLREAIGAFVLGIITGHGEPANRYCNKDPFTLNHMGLILDIFPNSKFVLMIRDGRSVAHSLKTRHVTITGWDIKTYEGALAGWNRTMFRMWRDCQTYRASCLPVWYEKLILNPEVEMRRVLRFLGLKWDPIVLHHEEMIGKDGGIVLAPKEPSTSQVKKPLYMDSLHQWVNEIPEQLTKKMSKFAPMLWKLGYNPNANPPDYSKMETRQWD